VVVQKTTTLRRDEMEAKKQIIFSHKSNDNEYFFIVPDNAPLGDCYSAAIAFFVEMAKKINEYTEQVKKSQIEEEKTEIQKVE
jgi:hypothetical protein